MTNKYDAAIREAQRLARLDAERGKATGAEVVAEARREPFFSEADIDRIVAERNQEGYRSAPPEQSAKDAELAMLRNDRWWQVYCAAISGYPATGGSSPHAAVRYAQWVADAALGVGEP